MIRVTSHMTPLHFGKITKSQLDTSPCKMQYNGIYEV